MRDGALQWAGVVVVTHELPPIPQRPYAANEAEEATKPVYRLDRNQIPFSRNVRMAAIDVMILTFAARRHAEWLATIGECPEDVARMIQADLDQIARLIVPSPCISGAGECTPPPTKRNNPTPLLWDATEAKNDDRSKA